MKIFSGLLSALAFVHCSIATSNAQSFQSFGLQGENVTALTSESLDRGFTPFQQQKLFAATDQDGVFRITAFEQNANWVSLGLAGKNVTALTVQHWGVGPVDGLRLLAGLAPTRTQKDSTFIYMREGEVGFFPDTVWLTADSGIDRQKVKQISALNSFYYTGHAPPMPRVAGCDNGLYQYYGVWNDVLPNEAVKINGIDVQPHWQTQQNHAWAVGRFSLSPVAYHSIDLGKTWTKIMLPSMIEAEAFSVAINPRSPDTIYVGMLNTIFFSSDTGRTWQSMNPGAVRTKFTAIAMDPLAPENVYAGGADDQNRWVMYQTTDGGKKWTLYTPPIKMILSGISSIVVMHPSEKRDPHVFISTLGTGVWLYRPGLATGTEKEITIPKQIHLSQNYPNPFSSSTTISFTLPQKIFVMLKVFNSLGQEVATLVNEEFNAGTHSAQISNHNSQLSNQSGVFFYRLTAPEFVETKKMVVIR